MRRRQGVVLSMKGSFGFVESEYTAAEQAEIRRKEKQSKKEAKLLPEAGKDTLGDAAKAKDIWDNLPPQNHNMQRLFFHTSEVGARNRQYRFSNRHFFLPR